MVLLGDRDDVVHLAVVVAPEDAPGRPEEWVPLRDVLTLVADRTPDQAPLLMHAIGLAEWHHATRFCPRCGGTLVSRAAGHELRCTQCDRAQFPRTDPAVIMAITSGEGDDEAILLGRNRAWPAGRWSTLAGFCEPGETLEDAVRREVHEEVGVHVGEVSYFGSQPWPLPASLMLGFTGRAVSTDIDVDGAEIEEARWWTRDDVRGGGPVRRARGAARHLDLVLAHPDVVRAPARRTRLGLAAAGQSQLSQMPVAGTAMKQRGHSVSGFSMAEARGRGVDALAARALARGALARFAGARVLLAPGGESSRTSKPSRVSALLAPSDPPGMSAGVSVRPVARPCAMPAMAAASYSRPWCSRTWVETPPRTSM